MNQDSEIGLLDKENLHLKFMIMYRIDLIAFSS